MKELESSPVRAKLKQDYNINLRLNIKDQKFDPAELFTKCKPRNTGNVDTGIISVLPGLTAEEVKNFSKINDEILQWVKASPENKKMLFDKPIVALQKSGVNLKKSLLKKINRINKENEKATPIVPGLNFKKLQFSVKPTILSKKGSDSQKTKK